MPKQAKKSSLAERLAKTAVREETRFKEAQVPGGGTLPAGVTGVAKLTRLDFDVMDSGDYAGEQRLYAHGVCVKPKTFIDEDGNEHVTEGALVQLSKINLCDTKNYDGNEVPFAQNWEKAENRLKLLGIPTEDIDTETFEESCLEYVNSSEMYFNFRTWKPEDSDRVSVVLVGPAKTFNMDSEDDVQEEADVVESPEEVVEKPAPKKKEEKKAAPKKKEPSPPEAEVEASEDSEAVSADLIRKLGEAGDTGDDSAQIKLSQIAEDMGIDISEIPDWAGAAEAILEKYSESDGEAEPNEEVEEGEEVVPEKEEIWEYNGEDCEITAVFPGRKTANVRMVESKKTYKSLPWSKLKPLA